MKKYTDIKSVEDACKYLELDIKRVIPSFESFPEEDREAMVSHCKLILVAKAINKLDNNYIPNWTNPNEYKYYPWFNMNDKNSASGFSYCDYGRWVSRSTIGSRLCFRTSEIAKYVGKHFSHLYEPYFVIKQKHTIVINGKEIELSEESYEALKKSLNNN